MAPQLGRRVYQAKDRRTALRRRRSRWLVKQHMSETANNMVPSHHRMNRLSRISKDDRSDSLIIIDNENDDATEVQFEDPWVPRKGKANKQYPEYDLLTSTSDDTSESTNKHLLEVPLTPELSADEEEDLAKHRSFEVRSYKRRYWMLFIFSMVSFGQYCCWNAYGPIATTAKAVFNWSNTEIAILASMDPITYLFTMVFFSWMMDVKGLRNSMLLSTTFMFVGTGLRCVTSDSKYAIWSMGVGQLLNGLAGPVTQAGPPLLSAYWFPSHQRTTATAVAALCGSFGVAMSFLIGPGFVKDVKTELDAMLPKPLNQSANVSFLLEKYTDLSLPLEDSVYFDAQHYWSLDELNITLQDTPVVSAQNPLYFPSTSIPSSQLSHSKRSRRSSGLFWRTEVMTEVRDYKSTEKGLAFGRVKIVPGIVNESVLTNGQDAWLKLGHFTNECLGEPALCEDGLTVSFWIKYNKSESPLQYFMGTSGTEEGYRGFLVYQDFTRDVEDHLTIKVENSTLLWERSFYAPRDTWVHVMFTWDPIEGLSIYTNGILSGKDEVGKSTSPLSPYYTTLTVGRPNDKMVFSNASFDEVAVWYRKLHPLEIETIHNRLNGNEIRDEWEFYKKAKKELIKEGENQIMALLYIQFGVVTVLFLAVVIYFPDKPPRPPSYSAKFQREDFSAGVKQIVKNPHFWTLGLVYGVTTGVYSGWGASLAVNLETFGISQRDASWLGFYATIAGIGAGLILARCADLFGGRMKALLVFLFFGSSGCFLWFALLCLRMIPFDNNSLYKSSVLGGFFVSGTIPLFYELTVETTYPVAEGVTTGLLTLINNTFTVIFLLILMVPGVGTVWMNWCMFGACAGCIPIMLGFREKYRRLDIDKGTNSDQQPNEKESLESKNGERPLSPASSVLDDVNYQLHHRKESEI